MRTNPSEMELEYFLPRWEAQPEMLSWAEYSKDHGKKRERQLRVNCQSKVVGAKVGGSGLLRLLYIDDQDLKQNFQKVVQSLSLLLTGKKSFTTSPPVTPLPRPTVQCPKAACAVRKRGKAHGVDYVGPYEIAQGLKFLLGVRWKLLLSACSILRCYRNQ